MKRFWLVLFSLGLALGFSTSAFAVDVKFSGSFYAAGMYLDKTNFISTYGPDAYSENTPKGYEVVSGPSTAFYYQRLRVGTDFIVSPGLKLVTRFDAMERIWGGVRSTTAIPPVADSQSAETRTRNITLPRRSTTGILLLLTLL